MIATEIKKLIDSGTLKVLLSAGIVSPTVKKQYEIYERYQVEKNKNSAKNKTVSDIVLIVATDYNVSERFVYKSLKAMRQ